MKITGCFIFGIVAFSLLSCGACFGIVAGVFYWRFQQAEDWLQTSAVVVSASVGEDTDPDTGNVTYFPDIEYRYQVAGQSYTNDSYDLFNTATSDRAGVTRTVEENPPGEEILIYYDPDNPADSVITRGDTLIVTLMGGAGAVMLVLGVGAGVVALIFAVLAARRRERPTDSIPQAGFPTPVEAPQPVGAARKDDTDDSGAGGYFA